MHVNDTKRYNYDGSTIILNYNNHVGAHEGFLYAHFSLLFDGKLLSPSDTWNGIGNQRCLRYDLPNGKQCLVDLEVVDTFIESQSLSIDGVKLTESRANIINRTRSLENLKTLAQYPPLGRLSSLEFVALKSLNRGSVVDWPEKKGQYFKYYLAPPDTKISPNGLISSSRLTQNGFVEIEFGHIKTGDNILVVKPFALGMQRAQLIENVSVRSTYRNGAMDFLGQMIEGENVTWTSMDLDAYKAEHIDPLLESTGLKASDMTKIITPSTTIDEWGSIGLFQRFDVSIVDNELTLLANGMDAHDVLDIALAREQSERQEAIEPIDHDR